MQVITPAPREEWRAVIAGDRSALPEQSPEWVDALCRVGRLTPAASIPSVMVVSSYYHWSGGPGLPALGGC
jgi:hypothetical protein